jgi:hypothetical protein
MDAPPRGLGHHLGASPAHRLVVAGAFVPYGLVTWLEAYSWGYLILTPAPRLNLPLLFRLRLGGRP